MRYLLHGDDIVSSRNFLSSLIDGYTVSRLEGRTLLLKDFEIYFSSTSLFKENKAIVVENLLSKNPKKKEFINFLNLQKDDTLLILWEDKKLSKTVFSELKRVVVKDFFLPSLYFQFLDNFTQRNGKKLFLMYQELIKTLSAEQIYYSLIKRVRLLLMMSENATSDELAKMSTWQKQKLQQQVRLWNVNDLMKFYEELTEMEIKLKSGGLPLGLSKHLDTLFLTRL